MFTGTYIAYFNIFVHIVRRVKLFINGFLILIICIALLLFRYMNRPVMSQPGIYDPTSIMNTDVLNKCQREGWIKLAFYLLSFFYYLYAMIYSLITY